MTSFIGILLYIIDIQLIHRRMVEKEISNDPDLEADVSLNKSDESHDTEVLERIAVKVGQKIHVILIPDIIYIEADGDYVRIITDHGKFMKEDTMKYYEAGNDL